MNNAHAGQHTAFRTVFKNPVIRISEDIQNLPLFPYSKRKIPSKKIIQFLHNFPSVI